MSINIKVCDSTISIKRKGVSLAAYQIDKDRSKKSSIELSTDERKFLAEKSSEKVDLEKNTNCCSKKKEVAKKKESSRPKLKKFEKRYKYLESNCYEYISRSRSDKQNQSLFRTNDSQPTNHSVCRLIEMTQQVLQLEQEVNAVLYAKSSRRFNDLNCMGFLMKLNKVKIRLLDEFDLNLSNQIPADSSHEYPTDDSAVNSELQHSNECSGFSDSVTKIDFDMSMATESASRGFDEDDQTIDMMTEKIVMDLKKIDSTIISNREINHSYESKKTNISNSTSILSDIPKVPPSFSRNTLLFKKKPPAYLKSKKYKRLNIDFTIHELSAIHEVTDSDISYSQRTVAV